MAQTLLQQSDFIAIVGYRTRVCDMISDVLKATPSNSSEVVQMLKTKRGYSQSDLIALSVLETNVCGTRKGQNTHLVPLYSEHDTTKYHTRRFPF